MSNLAGVRRLSEAIAVRQEGIIRTFGAPAIAAALADFRSRFSEENHRVWNRRRRDIFNDQWPEWVPSASDCIQKYSFMMSHYVDVAAWILARYLKGESLEDLSCAAAHARAADNLFWSLNRKPAGGLDKTLERLDRLIVEQLRPVRASKPQLSVAHILAILPDGLGPLEHFLSETYIACQGQDLSLTKEGRSLLWAIGFDRHKLANVPQVFPSEQAHIARAEAESLSLSSGISGLGDLLDQHDALAYLSSFVEPLWGFKGWPGLVLSAVRHASGEQ